MPFFHGSLPLPLLHSPAHGEMAEWPKARDSKSRKPQKGFEGSNPSLSAIYFTKGKRGFPLVGSLFLCKVSLQASRACLRELLKIKKAA